MGIAFWKRHNMRLPLPVFPPAQNVTSKSLIILHSFHYYHFHIWVPKDESKFFRVLSNRSYIFNHTVHRTLAFYAFSMYFYTSSYLYNTFMKLIIKSSFYIFCCNIKLLVPPLRAFASRWRCLLAKRRWRSRTWTDRRHWTRCPRS